MNLKVAIAQLDQCIGAFDQNVEAILKEYQRAVSAGARVLVTPELSVCGYPPYDLVERPEWVERCEAALDRLAKATEKKNCAIIVGSVTKSLDSNQGKRIQNSAVVLDGGKRVFSQAKSLLPTYDVFDEARYYEPAKSIEAFQLSGSDGKPVKIALAICEDLWSSERATGEIKHSKHAIDRYRELKPDLLISISASPYEMSKHSMRLELHQKVCDAVKAPLIYCNSVGAMDEILFDGCSFAFMPGAPGTAVQLSAFRSETAVIDFKGAQVRVEGDAGAEPARSEESVLIDALVTGIRSYFQRTKFSKALIGLSGGIDSAVVASLAVQALGRENVRGVAMPSQYSSGHSLEDAEILAKNLGIAFEVHPIKFAFSSLSRELSQSRGGSLAPLAQENLQSRLRGLMLMTLSNHDGSLVLTTGNKSEIAVGYCTMYGDMVGALAPIGDLYKTQVYALAREINRRFAGVIPERTITKAPSAELKPNQTDQDSLPPYEWLDRALAMSLEGLKSCTEIEAELAKEKGEGKPQSKNWVAEIIRKVEISEYKRKQAAPILKVSSRAFGIGRRVPLA